MKHGEAKRQELRKFMDTSLKNLRELYVQALKNRDQDKADQYDLALGLMSEIDGICQRRGRY